jgi:hypothetical protein
MNRIFKIGERLIIAIICMSIVTGIIWFVNKVQYTEKNHFGLFFTCKDVMQIDEILKVEEKVPTKGEKINFQTGSDIANKTAKVIDYLYELNNIKSFLTIITCIIIIIAIPIIIDKLDKIIENTQKK